MRVDDIADRQRGVLADGRAQRAPDAHRATGVDDRDATAADDEADVGDVVVARRVERKLFAGVHEHARRYLLDHEGLSGNSAASDQQRRDRPQRSNS